MHELLEKYASISENGFAIDLASAAAEWNAWMTSVGVRKACAIMSDQLCERYRQLYGREFLFSNNCVAYEIEYHVDGFMYAQGFKGYRRNVTTLLFSRKKLIAHCRVIDISTDDVNSWKQKTMFSYRPGVRQIYRNTDKDPFDRRSAAERFRDSLRKLLRRERV
ncbi:MAG: hypothetical protein IJL08_09685 [Oscillospiraceae bacterium]|nr:hypothetical protein [Oscillospiraceae bacterium]